MGFFDDVFIPADALQHPSKLYPLIVAFLPFLDFEKHFYLLSSHLGIWFIYVRFTSSTFFMLFEALISSSNEQEQLWAWEYDTGEGKHDLYMDIDEEIR